MRLKDKVAVITGAAHGQGKAEAALFRAEGAEVVITDIDFEAGTEAADALGAVFVRHDVSDEAGWQEVVDTAVARYGRVDILVNNAGIFARGDLLGTSLDLYRKVIDVNQVGAFLGMKAVAPVMMKQASGSIINVSSIAGLRAAPNGFAYGASKAAVTGMTRSAARTLGPHGVRVNSVHPGMIETDMMDVVTDGEAETFRRLASTVPLGGRHASAAEVAPLVLFLASDESNYCTGAAFVIDGGVMA
ncbi:SDR family NAD(P)-dependent oxidoreductase [Phenylobacterium sp. VNQ135]|uniref:SDR family NAD(P)-dependent oxidoreductase n=1 Tax=Phenylobacterium sp. VNQ135 TaxID=3400922 RepID=UPI003BFBA5BC